MACASPAVEVAGVESNINGIQELIFQAYVAGADAVVFPELCVTAYTCGDLFHNRTLLDASNRALLALRAVSGDFPELLIVVGAPVEVGGVLYNCALIYNKGEIVAAVSKTYIPNYNEFYERRWFASASDLAEGAFAELGDGVRVAVSASTVVRHGDVGVGVEICEDLWTPIPPSSRLALEGAEVIFNLSASDDLIGKYSYVTSLVAKQSASCLCAYAYASAGFGESSTDLVFDAKLLVAENGRMLAANERWQHGNQLVVADIDIEAIRRDRIHNGSFGNCAARERQGVNVVQLDNPRVLEDWSLMRAVESRPFVPSDDSRLKERCEEILNIQVAGLAKRLVATNCRTLVIGISGGLDSTLAILVAARAFDKLGYDRKGLVAVTMPGFGTTGRTYNNAVKLIKALGASFREISIVAAVNQHFADIGHDASVTDVTYENSQARERTQLLMDIANQTNGMVLGTGDLSELALGWATYNGDHMSMYAVNAGVPKTLVKYLTRYYALEDAAEDVKEVLLDIIDTPISPELIPADADGNIAQKTEDLVGPYDLHDFFLYYMLRYGFTPTRIYLLALEAFRGEFAPETILYWMRTFFRRFFNQQFKRSCLPDGPKVGSVCLSPRGDWRMPSDATSALWLKEIDEMG